MTASLLIGVAGLGHPVLQGHAAVQLAKIAVTEGWREIHWCISFGYVMAIGGIAGISALHASSPGAPLASVGVVLAVMGVSARPS